MDKGIPNHVFAKHQLVIQRSEGRRFPTISSYEMRPFLVGFIFMESSLSDPLMVIVRQLPIVLLLGSGNWT
jgi:hypothetical protein